MNSLTNQEYEKIAKVLELGTIYIYGSDKQYRPVIIIRIDDNKV